jgi:heme/copper-type cytochrome/quinol oxidase subunit 2
MLTETEYLVGGIIIAYIFIAAVVLFVLLVIDSLDGLPMWAWRGDPLMLVFMVTTWPLTIIFAIVYGITYQAWLGIRSAANKTAHTINEARREARHEEES